MQMSSVALSLTLVILALLLVQLGRLRRRRGHRRRYQEVLQAAIADGVLSLDERAELDVLRREKELTEEEVRMAALAIYRGALRDAAADARLTPEEDEALPRLQRELNLTETDLAADRTQVTRLRILAKIAEGQLPTVTSPVPMASDEQCHWVVQCTVADHLALHASQRELRGINFTILDDAPFVSGPRDPLRPADEIMPSELLWNPTFLTDAIGMLVITSRRVVFQGARLTTSLPHARIAAVTLYADGIRLDEVNASTRRYLLVDDAELTTAVLLQAARSDHHGMGPAGTGPMA
jgi:hypothetical protein